MPLSWYIYWVNPCEFRLNIFSHVEVADRVSDLLLKYGFRVDAACAVLESSGAQDLADLLAPRG